MIIRQLAKTTNIGALLVLLACAVELTIERFMKESLETAILNRTEEKIEAVWWLLADQHSKRPDNTTGPWIGTNLMAQFDNMAHPRNFEVLEAQVAWTERIRVWMQLGGGVLVLVGVIKHDKGS